MITSERRWIGFIFTVILFIIAPGASAEYCTDLEGPWYLANPLPQQNTIRDLWGKSGNEVFGHLPVNMRAKNRIG